ncbi:hypothetical protein MAR_038493, partial [Mya arenaria]
MLDSETSRNQWGHIYDQLSIHLIGCVCNFCTNKLNRIRRLTDESKTKARALLSERDRIVAELKELPEKNRCCCRLGVVVCAYVSVKYRQQERTYIFSNKLKQKLVKVLINKGSESAFCKHLSKCPRYKSAMKEQVVQGIKHEVDQVVKNREDLLRVSSIDFLLGFDWRSIIKALDKKVPTLMSVLRGVVSGEKNNTFPHLVTADSI